MENQLIPQYYPVRGNALYAGEYPGAPLPADSFKRLTYLLELGVRTFIDLTTPDDGLIE